jgi:50S ribosomal subunit-associated GTPase HflX
LNSTSTPASSRRSWKRAKPCRARSVVVQVRSIEDIAHEASLAELGRLAERAALRAKHPDAIVVSAQSPEDVAMLRETIIAFFGAAIMEDELMLPYAKQSLLAEVYDNARVLSEEYDAVGRILKVRGLPGTIGRLRRALQGS